MRVRAGVRGRVSARTGVTRRVSVRVGMAFPSLLLQYVLL